MRIIITIIALFSLVSTASAVRCYVCNSHNDTDCMDIAPGTKEKFLKDCDTLDDHKYTLCRKIDMYFDADFGENHPAENRIHRACGYIENDESSEGPCYYKSGYNTRSWVCSCGTDDCNSAHETISDHVVIISTTIFLAFALVIQMF